MLPRAGEMALQQSSGSWVISSPAVAHGKVYFGTSDSSLFHVVDAATGKPIFKQQGKAYVFSSPSFAGDVVFLGILNGTLEARDLASGALLWEFQTEASKRNADWILTAEQVQPAAFFSVQLARGADRRDGPPIRHRRDLLVAAGRGRHRVLRQHRRHALRAGIACGVRRAFERAASATAKPRTDVSPTPHSPAGSAAFPRSADRPARAARASASLPRPAPPRPRLAIQDAIARERRIFAPGSSVPTRFSGSAALNATHLPASGARRASRNAFTASGSANCSPETPATKRPPRTSPRASSRRSTRSSSRHGGSHAASRCRIRREHDAVAAQQRMRDVLDGLGVPHLVDCPRVLPESSPAAPRACSAQRPASSTPKSRAPCAAAAERLALLRRRQQRAQAREAVGRHEAERDQFRERSSTCVRNSRVPSTISS